MSIKKTLTVSETNRDIFFKLNPNRKKVTEKSLLKSGFKRGYGVWITPGDLVPDEDF